METLKIENLNKIYKISSNDTFQALHNLNLEFKKGELVSIVGESGSGKSTLMNIIGGLDSKFDGFVLVNGKSIKSLSERELDNYRKNNVGFVFQSFNLIPHLSILDNVTIAMTLSNVKESEKIYRATEMLRKVGLEAHIKKKPNQLSGGQKQRVAIARALINDPDIILADEPTGALDSQTTIQILDILKRIADEGKLVIMVTHSEKVASISSRVIELNDGKIISDTFNKDYKKEKVKKPNPTKDELNENKELGEDKNVNKKNKNSKDKQNLSFRSSIKMSTHNMLAHKTKNILMAIGVAIGIMSVILMLSFGAGIQDYINAMMNDYANPLVVEVTKKSENPSPTDMFMPTPFDEDVDIPRLTSIDGVVDYELGFTLLTMLTGGAKVSMGDKSVDIAMLDTAGPNLTEKNITEGNLPGKNQMVLSDSVKKVLGDVVGEEVKLTVSIKSPTGIVTLEDNFVVSGLTKGNDSTNSESVGMVMLFVNYNDLKTMAEKYGYGDSIKPTSVFLITENEKVAKQVKQKALELGYSPSTQETMLNMFNEMSGIMSYALAAIAGISLLVSAIMILVVLYISVTERTKEIGVLKSIGARRKDIKRIFTSESFLIGLLSGILGILGSVILGLIINAIIVANFGISIVGFKWYYMLAGLIVSILISVLSGLYPASKAAKLDPVESLNTNN